MDARLLTGQFLNKVITQKNHICRIVLNNLTDAVYLINSMYFVINISLSETGIARGTNLAGCKVFKPFHCICEMTLTGKT
jgi:hypothetical protein